MSREPDVNVVGGELQPCSSEPLTGFFLDGCFLDATHEEVLGVLIYEMDVAAFNAAR